MRAYGSSCRPAASAAGGRGGGVAAAPQLPADAVDRRVGAQVAEQAVAVERQRRGGGGGGRPAPHVLGGGRPVGRGERRVAAGRRRRPSSLAHGRAA